MRFRLKRRWIYFALSALVLVIAGAWWIKISMPVASDVNFTAPNIWSHRGSGGRIYPENSPEAVTLGIDEGFRGIEVDIFYFPSKDKIVVSHDRPRQSDSVAKPILSTYHIPPDVQLWLDFKNLGELNGAELAKFATQLRNLPFYHQVIIEGKSIFNLYRLQSYGFRAVLWLHGWTLELVTATKYLARIFNFYAVSVDNLNLEKVLGHFQGRSIFVFTVNDPVRIRGLLDSAKISVVLTDLSCRESNCAPVP